MVGLDVDMMGISWDISGILVDIPSGNSMAGNFPSSRPMILQHMASSGISHPCLMTPEGRSLHFALKVPVVPHKAVAEISKIGNL